MGPSGRLIAKRRRRSGSLLFLLPWLLFFIGQRPAAAAGLSMAEAVDIALRQNPQVTGAIYNYKSAEANVGIVRAPWLPQLSSATQVRGDYNYQTALPYTNSLGMSGCDPKADLTCVQRGTSASSGRYSSSLNLTQTIFDFGRTYYNINEAKALARAAIGDLNNSKQQVALGAITGFLGVLQQEALQRVAVATLAQQEQRLQQIQGFFSIGTKAEIDLLTQKTAVAQARLQLVQADAAVRLARVTFQQALGGGDAAFQTLEEPPDRPLPEESKPADTILQTVVESRPEVVGNRERYISAIENAKGLRGGYLPTLSLSGSASIGGVSGNANAALSAGAVAVGSGSGGTTAWQPAFALSGALNLTWTLFSGLSTVYSVRQAWAQAAQAKAALDLTRQQVRATTQQALLQVTQSREALTAADAVLVQAEKQLDMANGRYKAGVGGIIEVGDAQLSATTARVQRVQAVYTLQSSRAALLLQLGQLIHGVSQP